MKVSQTLLSAAAAVVTTFALVAPAQAVLPPVTLACSVTTITVAGHDAEACRGFYSGQYLSGNAGDIAVAQEALAELGFAWDGNLGALTAAGYNLSGLSGATLIDFPGLITGTAYIGVHTGGGGAYPGFGSTSFYRFDAGAGVDTFTLNVSASSDVILYNSTPAVPEPETYALLLAGLGVIGFMARRRRAAR